MRIYEGSGYVTEELPVIKQILCADGNSVRIHCIKTDKFKGSRLTVYIANPLTGENYISNIMLLRCIRRGTDKYSSLDEINRRLDDLYSATLTVDDFLLGDSHILQLSAGMLDERYIPEKLDIFGKTLEIMSDILLHPTLSDRIIVSERKNLEDEIKSISNDTELYSSLRCVETMFEGQPTGVTLLNSLDRLSKITPDSLREAYGRLFRNSQVDFFYVGAFDGDFVAEQVAKAFSGLRSGRQMTNSPYPVVSHEIKYVCDRMNVKQGKLEIGFRSNITHLTENRRLVDAMDVLSELIDDRMFVNLREKLGLCYSVEADYRFSVGAMYISCTINPCDRAKTETAVFSQIKSIADGNITDSELSSAVKKRINANRAIYDSAEEIDSYWQICMTYGLNEAPSEVCERLEMVTVADLVEAAGSLVADTVYFLDTTGGNLNE